MKKRKVFTAIMAGFLTAILLFGLVASAIAYLI